MCSFSSLLQRSADSSYYYLVPDATDCVVRCLYKNLQFLYFCWDGLWAFGDAPDDGRCRMKCKVASKVQVLLQCLLSITYIQLLLLIYRIRTLSCLRMTLGNAREKTTKMKTTSRKGTLAAAPASRTATPKC